MTRKLLSTSDWKQALADEERPEGTVIRLATAEPSVVSGVERTLRFTFSDATVDRAGDVIDPKGWVLDQFLKNPVALWAHDSSSPPIGRASNLSTAGGSLKGDIEFMSADISPFADSVFKMVKGGFVKAVSVGFMPIDWKYVNSDSRPFGMDFIKQELLEISVCPVPCNPSALIEARSLGIDVAPIRDWAEQLLDGVGHVLVPRSLLEETFRAAKTAHSVRRKYLNKDGSKWEMGAGRDLPLDDAESWDGPAAAKRMLDAAGFDGDSPDAAKAARGFLVHDSANPTLRGSYKLPFADIVGGSLKAVKGGIRAAASRLEATDAPSSVLDEAKGVIDAYEKQFGMGESGDKALGESTSDAPPTAPAGSCGRDKSAECGMKDMTECAIHAPPVDKDKTQKSGRRVSSANAAQLQKALDHHASAQKAMEDAMACHASAAECINAVLGSNETDPDGDGDNDAPASQVTVVELTTEDPRAKRLREAKALKDSLK